MIYCMRLFCFVRKRLVRWLGGLEDEDLGAWGPWGQRVCSGGLWGAPVQGSGKPGCALGWMAWLLGALCLLCEVGRWSCLSAAGPGVHRQGRSMSQGKEDPDEEGKLRQLLRARGGASRTRRLDLQQ